MTTTDPVSQRTWPRAQDNLRLHTRAFDALAAPLLVLMNCPRPSVSPVLAPLFEGLQTQAPRTEPDLKDPLPDLIGSLKVACGAMLGLLLLHRAATSARKSMDIDNFRDKYECERRAFFGPFLFPTQLIMRQEPDCCANGDKKTN